MKILGNGADTQIGERGINISGGQKARISLARAVYSNADIVLLDDPLSAVDPKVAKLIFSECIRGALSDKIVVLVTHQLQFLEDCPQIMLLKNGEVSSLGSYSDLEATGYNIKDILDSFNNALTAKDGEKNKFKDEVKKTESAAPSPVKKEEEKKEEEPKKEKPAAADASKDLIVAEEKFEEGVGLRDYLNLFSFSIGAWAILIYFLIAVASAVL